MSKVLDKNDVTSRMKRAVQQWRLLINRCKARDSCVPLLTKNERLDQMTSALSQNAHCAVTPRGGSCNSSRCQTNATTRTIWSSICTESWNSPNRIRPVATVPEWQHSTSRQWARYWVICPHTVIIPSLIFIAWRRTWADYQQVRSQCWVAFVLLCTKYLF